MAETPNPPQDFVSATATRTDALDLDHLALIGIFGQEGDRRALLRAPDGVVLPVRVGDETSLGTVVAIGQNAIHLARAGRVAELLGLPED